LKLENRINEQIKIPRVRLIDEHGKQIGVVDNYTAKNMAMNSGLDLVEINPNSNPPVCKIMDFGKYCYEFEKNAKKNKQVVIKTKEIQFHPNIQMHDYSYKLEQARRFLTDGNKVKACIVFRGREMNYIEKGEQILKKLIEDLSEISVLEQSGNFEGKVLSIIFRKS